MRKLVFGIIMIVCCLFLKVADSHAFPRNLEWRTVETEHFRIAYHEGLENLADRLAHMAEDVYNTLSPFLEHESTFKTEIVLVDHVDSPNGLVNVYPYNYMMLYAVPPDRLSVLNDSDDWFRSLFVHEQTHILQLDTKSGLPRIINYIFGGLMHPNQYMPRWYTEGIAIFDESRFTAGGRIRSSIFEMYLRMDVYENRMLTIDQINGNISRWPYGHAPYLYGGKFMQYLADKYGEKTFAALGYLYGQRMIPLALNTVLSKVTDDNYVRLYDEWAAVLRARYTKDVERLKLFGLTEVDYITDHGENHDSPVMFPTGDKILYYNDDEVPGKQGWAILDLKTKKYEIAIDALEDGGATINPDGRRVVTGEIAYTENEYRQFDLFMNDLERKTRTRLTFHQRAREPNFAPDGRELAYVSYGPGSSHIRIMNVDNGDYWLPIPKDTFDQVFTPVYSPDGRYLAFTGWRFNGFKDLYLFDFEANRVSRITNDRNLDLSPSWSADGKTLYWTSDRTGIYNIYSMNMDSKRIYQLTNVVGGLFSPLSSIDGSKLYVSSYRSHGFDLGVIELKHQKKIVVAGVPEMRGKMEYGTKEVKYVDKPYSPFPSLYPKLWQPTWGDDHAGMTLGIKTWGDDIARQHRWSAEFDMGVKSAQPTIGLSYSNRSFTPNIGVSFAHVSYTLVDAGMQDGEYIDLDESKTSGSFSVSLPFRKDDHSHSLSLNYNFRYTRLLNKFEYEPTEIPPTFVETGLGTGLNLTWSYSNRRSYSGYFGTASGRSMYISVRTDAKLFGGDWDSISIVGGYNEYIPNPWIEKHVLALKFNGGIGFSTNDTRKIFYLGGPPDQDIVDDLIRRQRTYGNYLRGYKPLSMGGNKYFQFKSEYRMVLWNIDRGLYTLPIFFKKVSFYPFFDCGYAWVDDFDIADTRKGLGAEVRLDLQAGYFTPIGIIMGYQYGFDEHGVSAIYFTLDNTF